MSRDINGFSDPYFKLKLKSQKFTSRVVYKTLNPVYNQDFEYIVSPADLITPGVNIKVECWDKAGPARYCPPRHPTHFLELKGVASNIAWLGL